MAGIPVSVVDYGVGNLRSVGHALRACGGDPQFVSTPEDILRAQRLILPGVGAFGKAMERLTQGGLDEALRAYAALQRPFLGICLGMQLMMESSVEFGQHRGLGLMAGAVVPVPHGSVPGRASKRPFIGWSPVQRGAGSAHTWFFEGLAAEAHFYFVHSYMAVPASSAQVVATTHYDDVVVNAVVGNGTLLGCQFHPEKSGHAGLRVLANFLEQG